MCQITLNGAEWFASMAPSIPRAPGLRPVARSTTPAWWKSHGHHPAEIIYDIGGGCPNGKKFKAVQTGGPPADVARQPADTPSTMTT